MKGSSIILNRISVSSQGNAVLKDISFTLQPGQHLAITGASGSGKTALAKAIAGQLHTQGIINIVWDESSPHQKKLLLVEQRNQFKNLSHTTDFYYQQRFNSFDAGDSETVWQALNDLHLQQNEEKLLPLLKTLGLYERRHAPLIQLSSGENKRFQLIKAILQQPQIVILDTPFTGLDKEARKNINHILSDLADQGTQFIIITSLQQIPDCITHVAVLDNGRLQNFLSKEELAESGLIQFEKHANAHSYFLPVTDEHEIFTDVINMRNVHVQYGEKIILADISWHVKAGDKWLVKGHNGAGKSTLLSLINGDNPQAYKNEIFLFGKRRGSGESIWDIKQKIGYVSPELHAFYDKKTTSFDTIASGFFDTIGLFKKLSFRQQQQVYVWIDAFGLQAVQNKALSALSSGTQRIVLLARALVKNPPLLILDEPCQGLDDDQRESFTGLINDLSEHYNKTFIYVSHYDNEVPGCIDNVIELNNGRQKIYRITKQAEFA